MSDNDGYYVMNYTEDVILINSYDDSTIIISSEESQVDKPKDKLQAATKHEERKSSDDSLATSDRSEQQPCTSHPILTDAELKLKAPLPKSSDDSDENANMLL